MTEDVVKQEDPFGWVVGLLALLAVPAGVVGLILGLFTNSLEGWGYGLFVGAAIALVPAFLLAFRDAGPAGRGWRLAVGLPLVLLVTVAAGVTFLALLGFGVRVMDPADYHGRYGTRVQATIDQNGDCAHTLYLRGPSDADWRCSGSWEVGGQTHTGTVILSRNEIPPPKQVDAYVLPDGGYSVQRVGDVESIAWWGAFPLWPLLFGLPVMVLGILVLRWIRFFEKAKPETAKQA